MSPSEVSDMMTGKDLFPNSHDEPQKTVWDFYKKTRVFPDKNSPDILFGNSEYMKNGQKEKKEGF